MRRVLRIFPVYFLYLFVVFGIMRQIYPEAFTNIRLWPYLVYVSNWQKGTGLTDFRLSHIWSLAIEEQFYLVWPLLVLLCPPRRLIHACTVVCLLALGLRIAATGHVAPQTIFRMTPFRADALASGAIIAAIFESERRTELIKRFAIPAAGTVLLLALVLHGGAYYHAVGFSVIVVVCAAAIFLAARYDPGFLRHRLLATVGKYSYGMYVYHILLGSQIWPWLRACQSVIPLAVLKWCYLLVAGTSVFAVAWVSCRYFELPFLCLKERFTPRKAPAPRVELPLEPSDTAVLAEELVPYRRESGAA
jgi:peptidoglycan/LPS O-acetylase OafA/YrhL